MSKLKTDRYGNLIVTNNTFKKYVERFGDKLQDNSKFRFRHTILTSTKLHSTRYTIYNLDNKNRFFNIIIKSNDITYINRVLEMINDFIQFTNYNNIYTMLQTKDDKYILNYIKKNYNMRKIDKNYKLLKISEIIEKQLIKYDSSSKPKILDFGTGNGVKIVYIKNHIDIDIDIYGTDIKYWGSYNMDRTINFNFKYIEENPYRVPYPDNYFDCITCILALHHIKDIQTTLKELKRILKKGGLIIIIEHDIWTDYDNIIIELQHKIYRHVYNEKHSYYGKYYNFYEWDLIMNTIDMKPIYGDRLTDDIAFKYRYDLQFIGVYKSI